MQSTTCCTETGSDDGLASKPTCGEHRCCKFCHRSETVTKLKGVSYECASCLGLYRWSYVKRGFTKADMYAHVHTPEGQNEHKEDVRRIEEKLDSGERIRATEDPCLPQNRGTKQMSIQEGQDFVMSKDLRVRCASSNVALPAWPPSSSANHNNSSKIFGPIPVVSCSASLQLSPLINQTDPSSDSP